MKKNYSTPEVHVELLKNGGIYTLETSNAPSDGSAQLGKSRSKNPIWDDEI